VACFDTAFHQTQSEIVRAFALPRRLRDAGVKRYGFHGLSYEAIATMMPAFLGPTADKRVIVAHLGNGASLCAMKERRSVATTMGMTPLDGLVMGTRCGAIDPGVLLYLQASAGYDPASLSHLLYFESGLLGVSGVSHDMRTLLETDSRDACFAVELFVHRVCREIGSLSAVLGGLDALLFTGGIGEHAAPVRESICRQSAWLGLEIDPEANQRAEARISTAGSRVSAWVIPTDEEAVIARHAARTLNLQSARNCP
jgi:acetate kinase